MPVSDDVPAAETIAEVKVEFDARLAVGVDEGKRLCDQVRQIDCRCQCLFRACIIAYACML